MWSGQFLFSFGQLPNVFNIVNTGSTDFHGIGVQTPPFTPKSADADTTFVVIEFSFPQDIHIDCTIVDYFCAPVALEVIGDTTKSNGILKSTSNRASIFDQINAMGTPWSNLIMKDSSGNNVRVLGPQHGVEQAIISSGIYDDYVNACWANFDASRGNTLTINAPTFGTYVGTTNSQTGQFTFTQSGQPDVIINKPAHAMSYDVFGCVGVLDAPNNTALGEIAAILGAALNRTVLKTSGSDTQPNCTIADFYQPQDGVTNEYAKVVHDNYQSGIYAFPYDDVCSTDNPLIQISNPTQLNITLSSWT